MEAPAIQKSNSSSGTVTTCSTAGTELLSGCRRCPRCRVSHTYRSSDLSMNVSHLFINERIAPLTYQSVYHISDQCAPAPPAPGSCFNPPARCLCPRHRGHCPVRGLRWHRPDVPLLWGQQAMGNSSFKVFPFYVCNAYPEI